MPIDPFESIAQGRIDPSTGLPVAAAAPLATPTPTPTPTPQAPSAPFDPFASIAPAASPTTPLSTASPIPPPPSPSNRGNSLGFSNPAQGPKDPRDIGFFRAAWQNINPVELWKGAQAGWEYGKQGYQGRKAIDDQYFTALANATTPKEREDLQDKYEAAVQDYGANFLADTAIGLGQGLYNTGKDIYEDFTQGRIRTGTGKVMGMFGPGVALKKLRGLRALTPPSAAAKADQALQGIRSKLPSTPAVESQRALHDVGRSASAEAFAQWETARKSARNIASKAYESLNEVLEHPSNIAPEGFPLRGEVKQGKKVIREGIYAKTPVQAPISTAPFQAELDAIMDFQRTTMLPEGHPINTFLKNIDAEVTAVKRGKKTKVTHVGQGYSHVRFMDMKKALGELKVMIDTPGVGWGPEQLLAKNIVVKAEAALKDAAVEMATRAGKDPKAFLAALDQADRQWASALRPFAKPPRGVAGSKQAFTEERAIHGEQFAYPKASPDISSIEDAIRTISPTNTRAQSILNTTRATTSKQATDMIRYITNNITNLENYLDIWRVGKGVDAAADVLGQVLTHIYDTKAWSTWKSLKPEVIARLTRHDPALATEIPKLLETMAQAETALGPQGANRALSMAAAKLGKIGGADATKLLMGSTSTRLQGLAGLLKRAATVKLLNRQLNTQVQQQLRYPKATRAAQVATGSAAVSAAQGTRRRQERLELEDIRNTIRGTSTGTK